MYNIKSIISNTISDNHPCKMYYVCGCIGDKVNDIYDNTISYNIINKCNTHKQEKKKYNESCIKYNLKIKIIEEKLLKLDSLHDQNIQLTIDVERMKLIRLEKAEKAEKVNTSK
jgi:hypothetical protein